jgi:phage baseplate assembly protein V
VFGQTLVAFRPRVSAAGQVGQFQVRGWDVQQKEAIVGSAAAGTTATELQDDPASLASLFGDGEFVAVDAAPADTRAANTLASRLAEQVGSSFAEATGVARGDPHLRAGTAISVTLAGDAFDGRYTLTHTRHVFDLRHGYETQLTVSGRQERSLLGLAGNNGRGGLGATGSLPGVVIGLVDDVADPDRMGRVKVRFPWLSDDYVGDWARVVMLGAGPDRGAVWLPEVGDEVLVAFEFGDVRHPIVVGGLWNGQDQPPEHQVDQGHLKVRSFVSRKGHKIRLSDDDNDAWIEVQTSNGQLTLKLDESGNEIKIAAGGAKLTVTADNDISIKANGRLSLEGTSGLDVVSSGVTKVKGQTLQLNPPG